jgi:translocation and assembly module TamB
VSARRKFLLLTATVAGLLLAGVVGLVAWLAYSEAGLARAVSLLRSLDSIEISVAGERGRLAGPLHLDSLDLRAGRVTLHAEGIDLDNDLAPVFLGRLSVHRLAVDSLEVGIGAPVAPPSDQPLRFLPRWLSIGLGHVSLGRLLIRLPNASELRYQDVILSGRMTDNRIALKEVAVDAGLWTASGAVTLLAQDPLALRGKLAWSVPGTPSLAGTLQADGDLAKLDIDARISDPVSAEASATLEDLASGLHWRARAESAAIDLSPWMAQPPVGPLAVRLEASGDLRIFVAAGHLDGAGLTPDGLDLQGTLVLDGNQLLLQPVKLSTPDGRMSILNEGGIRFSAERSLDIHSTWSGIAWPLSGQPVVSSRQGMLDLRGWSSLEFSTQATVSPQGLPEIAINASGQADRAGIALLHSDLKAGDGRAEVQGYFGFDPTRPWSLDATVHELDLSSFRPGLDSRLSFRAAGSGQGLDRDSPWAGYVGSIKGSFRGQKFSGAGFLRHQKDRYDIQQFAFDLGPARLEIDGHAGRQTDLSARLVAPDLSGFLPQLGGQVEATLHARSAGSPRDDGPNLRVDLSARGRDLHYGEQRAAVLSADADIDLSDRETSWLRLRAAGVQLAGQDIASTRISLDGRARGHTVDFQVGAGERAVSLVGEGRYESGVYRLTAERIESTAPRLHPFRLERPMSLVVEADAARLEETCFADPPRRVCLRADWKRDSGWSAGLTTRDFALRAARPDLSGQPVFHGLLDLDVTALERADLPWTATGAASLRDAWLEYATPSGRQERISLGVTHISLDSTAERHHLSATIDDTGALQLRGEATIGRNDQDPLGASPLAATLDFSTERLGLLPMVVPDIDKAEGKIRAHLTLAGTAAEPVMGGSVVLQDGLLEVYQTNLRMSDTSANIQLLDHGLSLESRGKAGDGTFEARGRFSWQDREFIGKLTLKGERLLVADIPEVRIEASPDLSFDIAGKDIQVKGSVQVPSARIEPRQLVGAVTSSADERLVGADEDQKDAAGYRISSELRLTLGKAVSLDAFGLKGRLEGSVVIQSRPDELATASGEFEIKDGKFKAYSKELDVDPGKLLFAGGPVTDPGIDLRASKKVPGYEVGVLARGRLRKPELSLFSDPSMPQSQIASLLLVGRRLDNLDTSSRQNLGGSTGDMAAQGGALLAGQLGRYLGIDEISYESSAASTSTGTGTGTGTSPSGDASLVIGKFLSPRLYISYGISLSNAINTFKLRYTIGDRWVITGEAGQEASADVEYTIDR